MMKARLNDGYWIILFFALVAGLGVTASYVIPKLVSTEPAAPSGTGGQTAPSRVVHFENNTVGRVTSVLPDDPAKAKPSDGASFLGYGWTPRNPTSVLRVHAVANAYTEAPNEVVLAVFRSGGDAPIKLFARSVSSRDRALFDVTFDIPVAGAAGIGLDFRIGPGRPGTVIFNGPEDGGLPAGVPVPSITLTEVE